MTKFSNALSRAFQVTDDPSQQFSEKLAKADSESAWIVTIKLLSSNALLSFLSLLALASVLYLPGVNYIPVTDRDEARFVQASSQMHQTEDYTHIYFQDAPRNKKPVGIYWLQNLSLNTLGGLFGDSLTAFRLVSVLSMLGALVALCFIALPNLKREESFLAAVILGTTVVSVAEAHIAKTDAALLFSVVGTMFCFGTSYLRVTAAGSEAKRAPIYLSVLGAIFLGAGVLIKGPVLPAVLALTAISLVFYERSISWVFKIRPIIWILVSVLLILPWLVLFNTSGEGGSFISKSFRDDIIPKLIGFHESHGGPPGYYAMLSNFTFWPWVVFAVPALCLAWQKRKDRHYGFLLCYLLPSWLAIELAPTKLPHYSLPLYPALAVLISLFLLRKEEIKLGKWSERLRTFNVWAWRIFLVGFPLASVLALLLFSGSLTVLATLSLGLSILLAWSSWKDTFKNEISDRNFYTVFASVFVVIPVFFISTFYNLEDFFLTRKAQAFVEANPELNLKNKISVDYHEPSLVFRLGTDLSLLSAEAAAKALTGSCGDLLILSDRRKEEFFSHFSAKDLLQPLGSVTGFNYNKGRYMTLNFYITPVCEGAQ